jgi:hypothetical protein
MLAACDAAREVDDGLRRIDVLDRVFAPDRDPDPRQAGLPPPVLVEPARSGVGLVSPEMAQAQALGEPPGWSPGTRVVQAEALPPVAAAPPLEARTAATVTPSARPEPPAPPPDPALRRRALLRQFPWVAQFWSELTQAQRGRVGRRLQADDTAAAWDRMGLAERIDLLFGTRSSTAGGGSGAAPPPG